MKAALVLVLSGLVVGLQGQERPVRVDAARVGPQLGQQVETSRPAAAKRIETNHLEVVTYASDDVVTPGSLFSLVWDITPRPGMHVYAPGAAGYKVIGVRLESNPLLITQPVQYAPAEIYHFKPLNERVPAYQKPFRLMQRMAISASREARAALKGVETFTIAGTLDYQACDERLCYPPRSIPLSYSVKLRPLEAQRAPVPRR